MKKILIAISIFMLLICAGCVPKLNPIETGEYYADGEKENKVFKKAKLEIYEITKEEYELANGINVFEIGDTEYDNEFHSAFHGSNYYFGIYLFYYDNKNNEGFVFKGNN